MTLCRLLLPEWARAEDPSKPKVLEGLFSWADIQKHNKSGYNVYFLPNHPSDYEKGTRPIDGTDIDTFEWVFVDMDLKDKTYASKEEFLEALGSTGVAPNKIVDSGGGVHAYWKVDNLDVMSYLRFQRRLSKLYSTDEATSSIFQLMRLPGTLNTKRQDSQIPCTLIYDDPSTSYTAEQLDRLLPPITAEDELKAKTHHDKTYRIGQDETPISDALPAKFGELLLQNEEVKMLFAGQSDDRSKSDYRLGHLMLVYKFTKDEALSVLINSAKALERAPIHRRSYAQNIVEKIWTFEETKDKTALSYSIADLLSKGDDEALKGTRFRCQKYFDGTEHGFRLSQVIGLCAGVGVGKTAIALNLFRGFVEQNPEYVHMFVSLEQPGREIAVRWKKMVGDNKYLHDKVHVISNYNDDGSYRNLSLTEIQDYILKFQKENKVKVGCVCLDHIGVLRQENRSGEYQGLRDICAQLKSFAVVTDTLFIIQSQTNREKAGAGDLELFKDAAYGTQSFEGFLDFLLVAWQPLKRCYDNSQCPRVTAYKFAKVRFKSKNDFLIEDQCYRLLFDQDTETLRPMTQDEETSFDYFAKQALNIRKKDRKTDLVSYTSIRWSEGVSNVEPKTDNSGHGTRH